MCWRHNNKSPVYDRSKVVLHGVLFRLAQFSPQHTILAVSCGRLQHATRELPKGQTHTHSTQKTFSLPRQAETVTKKQQDPQSLFNTTTTHTASLNWVPASMWFHTERRARTSGIVVVEGGWGNGNRQQQQRWLRSFVVKAQSFSRWSLCCSVGGLCFHFWSSAELAVVRVSQSIAGRGRQLMVA